MVNYTRADGRQVDELRPITVEKNWVSNPAGSCLINWGNTRVLATASFTDKVPRWLKGKGTGWLTAEYSMLPAATDSRNDRESVRGKLTGRTHEISRLIGRSLRPIVNLDELGENTIAIDCDVLQADGGTRCASITAAFIALRECLTWAIKNNKLDSNAEVLIDSVSAVSVGIVNGIPVLDLPYIEDSTAETDMNVVQTGSGKFIEVQGTAEGVPFDKEELDQLLALATKGNAELHKIQNQI
jgi:ribonuclease PH